MASSVFAEVPLAPKDPILGVTETFNADTRPEKVNLGVGVYYDENGKLPLLNAVRQAEDKLTADHAARGYLPIDGINPYNRAVQSLLFGADSPVLAEKRAVTVQALGGTGGLRVGGDMLRRFGGDRTVYISDPSWENHRALFEAAGFTVKTYPYYDAANGGVRFTELLQCISTAPEGSIFVLHACCHNPTGADLSPDQWAQVIALLHERNLFPFIDMAYQGFDKGIDEDALAIRLLAQSPIRNFVVASSYSKSFSLYGERVGAFTVVSDNADESKRVQSQIKRLIRANYSSPSTHGAALVAGVLNDPALRVQWEDELGQMRTRIHALRAGLVEKLAAKGAPEFGFIQQQAGMFSYSGLSKAQVDRLRDEFGIYAVGTGRICVAALSNKSLDYVADAVAAVGKG